MKRSTVLLFTISFLLFFSMMLADDQGLGSTHFIIGVESSEVHRHQKDKQLKRALHVDHADSPILRVFFAPDDDTRSVLLNLIDCEQEKISVAAFLLTDRVIAQALLNALARGVTVECVADQFCCRGKYGKALMLVRGGIDLLVYRGARGRRGGLSDIMHNKFMIFKKNLLGRSLVWTGSFNFTNSARLRNQENVILLDDETIVARFATQFELIKSRCVRYSLGMFRNNKKEIAQTQKREMRKHSTKDRVRTEARA